MVLQQSHVAVFGRFYSSTKILLLAYCLYLQLVGGGKICSYLLPPLTLPKSDNIFLLILQVMYMKFFSFVYFTQGTVYKFLGSLIPNHNQDNIYCRTNVHT